MRKASLFVLIALVLASTSGCQCCDALLQFEAWKNRTLFGCFCPCLYGCGQNNCPPNTTYPATTCPPTYGNSLVAPLTSQSMVAPSYAMPGYTQSVAAPYTDCSGSMVVGSPIVDCSGATIVSSPVCQDGCGTGTCGSSYSIPSTTVVTPGPALTPTPVPSLPSESYAPPATR
jgi:hypothetical protein